MASITTWTGNGATESLLEAANWSNGVPDYRTNVVYDGAGGGNALKNCLWEGVTEVLSVSFLEDYTGDVDVVVDLHILDDLSGTFGSSAEFNIGNNTLYIDGNYQATGAGRGLVTGATAPVFIGGNYDTIGLGFGDQKNNPVKFIGSRDNPTQVKEHFVLNPGFDRRLNDLIVGQNQTIVLQSDVQTEVVTCELDSGIKSDGGRYDLDFRNSGDILVNPNFCTWGGSSFGEGVVIKTRGGSLTYVPGADYGNCSINALIDTDFTGNIITTYDIFLARNGNGTSICRLLDGKSITCRDLSISGITTKAADFQQGLNTKVTCMRDARVKQDNTVEVSRWYRVPGENSVTIHGQLICEADGSIDWNDTTGTTEVGGINFNSNANINVNNIIMDIIGDNVVLTQNAGNGNRNIRLRLVDGKYCRISGNVYCDNFHGPVEGNAFLTGSGQLLVKNYSDGERVTCIANTDGGATFNYTQGDILAYDYGNWAVSGQSGAEIRGGVGHFQANRLDVFSLQQNTTVTYTVIDEVDFTVGTIKISDTAINNRGGNLVWNSAGKFTVNDITINDIDGVQQARLQFNAAPSMVDITDDLRVGVNGRVDVNGAYTLNITDDIVIDDTADMNWQDATICHKGDGDITNSQEDNAFYELIVAAEEKTTIFRSDIYITGRLAFGGGSLNTDSNLVDFKVSTDAGIMYEGLSESTVNDGGGAGSVVGVFDVDILVDGGVFPVPHTFSSSNGSEIKLIGNFDTSGDTFTISDTSIPKLRINGKELRCGVLNLGDGTGSVDVNLGSFGNIIAQSMNFDGPNNILNGIGSIDLVQDLNHLQGNLDLSIIILNCRSYLPAAGVTATFLLAQVSGDFNPSAVAFTMNWIANGELVIVGVTDSDVAFSGQQEPGAIKFRKGATSATTLIDGPVLGNTQLQPESYNFSQTVVFTPGVNYSITTSRAIGADGSQCTYRSPTNGVQFNIAASMQGPGNRYLRVRDSNLTGVIIQCDTNTGADLGNNNTPPPDGWEFLALPDPENGIGTGSGQKVIGNGPLVGIGKGKRHGFYS